MRPFFRVKNGGRWRMNNIRGRNLRGKCIVCLFNLTDNAHSASNIEFFFKCFLFSVYTCFILLL